MKIAQASVEILTPIDREAILKSIERAGRTCYKSEENITLDSAAKFIKTIIDRKHDAMLEHANISVKFICDRGVSHEIVRHRISSFAQESTRYCNYAKSKFGSQITVIDLATGFMYDLSKENDRAKYAVWTKAMEFAESSYMQLLALEASAQEARSVLPQSLKTEIVMTANLREWRHFLRLRSIGTTGAPHPQMKEVADKLLEQFVTLLPDIFGDIV